MFAAKGRGMMWAVAVLLGTTSAVTAADWPHWLGPNRNGSSPEKNLLTTWPKKGPKVLWKVEGGEGYSTIAVVGQRAYTLVQRDGKEWAIALDVKTGKQVWQTAIGPEYRNQFGNGPRSTPTVDNDHVYVQSVTGPVACLRAATGKVVWQRHLLKEFGAKNVTWGLSASPVVDGALVYVIPGAKKTSVAALNKKTGKVVWSLAGAKAAYSSPMPVPVAGKTQVIFFNAGGLLAVDRQSGKQMWRIPWKTEFDCNICTPLLVNNNIFVTSGEKVGCAMLQLSAGDAPNVVWQSKGPKSVLVNYWANSVYHDGHLYGLHGEFSRPVSLRCVDAKSGTMKWNIPRFGLSSVTLAAGHLFITTKKGDLVLAQASPAKYIEKARIPLLGQNRTSPTISNGRMFLRDRQNIYCLDISAPE